MQIGSFVAIGDSFTEGLDDPYPDPALGYRGWADLVAQRLAARRPDFGYANLALRGRLIGGIVDEQVPAVEELRPDLISVAAGGNDVLRRHYDPRRTIRLLDEAVDRLVGTGAEVLLFTGADVTTRMPGTARLRPRISALNGSIREVGAAHGVRIVDLDADRGLDDPRLWSEDRLHLGPAGHRGSRPTPSPRSACPPRRRGWRRCPHRHRCRGCGPGSRTCGGPTGTWRPGCSGG